MILHTEKAQKRKWKKDYKSENQHYRVKLKRSHMNFIFHSLHLFLYYCNTFLEYVFDYP